VLKAAKETTLASTTAAQQTLPGSDLGQGVKVKMKAVRGGTVLWYYLQGNASCFLYA